ncbi:MAG: hypothetical protein KC910_24645 [Candidatus Eremiobacteraeota bacterium]|nr:hypothetical protein [Candidatus Eremiobacteraeota bacterium]
MAVRYLWLVIALLMPGWAQAQHEFSTSDGVLRLTVPAGLVQSAPSRQPGIVLILTAKNPNSKARSACALTVLRRRLGPGRDAVKVCESAAGSYGETLGAPPSPTQVKLGNARYWKTHYRLKANSMTDGEVIERDFYGHYDAGTGELLLILVQCPEGTAKSVWGQFDVVLDSLEMSPATR